MLGEKCSVNLMKAVGLDSDAVLKCAQETKTEKLRKERQSTAWSPRALRINGYRFTGTLDSDLVTRAVCSGFTERPAECEQLLAGGLSSGGDTDGISGSTVILAMLFLVSFLGALMYCYNRAFQENFKKTVREEIMMEVQQQMAEYTKL